MDKLSELPKPYLCDLRHIKLERNLLENCYVCLEDVTHRNPAVFLHKCKHNICIECLRRSMSTSGSTRGGIVENCGICRAQSNKIVKRAKMFIVNRHNSIQSICVPEVLAERNSHPHCDLLQKMICGKL
mgnify:CR=1 FL=1